MKKNDWAILALCIIVPLAVSFLISLITPDFVQYYESLNKPKPYVSPKVFPIVWSILYVLIGIASYLIYKSPNNKRAMRSYIYQLIINFLWTPIYFGTKTILFGNLYTLLLLLMVLTTTIEFFKINKKAGYLFLPYAIWVLFAYYLTLGILILNI